MRALGVAVFLPLLFVGALAGDTREVIKTTVAGHETVYAELIRGRSMRIEDLSQDVTGRPVTIQNFERKRMYQLDLQSREYVEWRPQEPDLVLSLAHWIARAPRTRESGKTVNIYYETIDTGEREQFFGRTARHFVLRERHVAEPGACDYTHQNERYGWYIPGEIGDPSGSYRLAVYLGVGNGGICRDTVVRHGDPSPPGVSVRETDGSVTREVLGLSNGTLDSSLFEVPIGFKKVEALPGYRALTLSERLGMEWALLERAFESWFD